ncbi:hypothetical protein M8J77_006124 [Diaphorina citri]|nr:hypothetical protein M8J77_006124 [Diaphorina citri]
MADYKLASKDVAYLQLEEVNFEIITRGGEPEGTLTNRRSQLRALMRQVKIGSAVIDDTRHPYDADDQKIVPEIRQVVLLARQFVGDEGCLDYNRLSARLNHYVHRVNSWPEDARGDLLTQVSEALNCLEDRATILEVDQLTERRESLYQGFMDNLLRNSTSQPRVSIANAPAEPVEDRTNRDPKIYSWKLKFTGENMPIDMFLDELDLKRQSRMATWEQIFTCAAELFDGPAKLWYMSRRNDFDDWDSLAEQLRASFGPINYDLMLMEEILTRRQQPQEPVVLYIASMRVMLSRLPLMMPLEQELRLVLKNSLPIYQEGLQFQTINSFDQLENLMKRIESCRLFTSPPPSTPKPHHPPKPRWTPNNQPSKGAVSATGGKLKPSVNSEVITEATRANSSRNHISTQTEVPTNELTDIHSLRGGDQRWHVTLNVCGVKIKGLVDTGASNSYISAKGLQLFKDVKLSTYRIPEEGVLVANGQVEKIDTIVNLPFSLEGFPGGNLPVKYLPNLSSALVLGLDFITTVGMVINGKSKRWFYSGFPEQTFAFINGNCDEESSCSGIQELTDAQRTELEELVDKAKALEPQDLGTTDLVEHRIQLTDYTPIRQRPYPVNPQMQQIINEEVEKMLADDVIEPSRSEWTNPILLVKKPDNTYRPVLDFRKLNAVTVKDKYPLPNMSNILVSLKYCKYISKLDLQKAFWLIPLAPDCRQFTAFQVPGKGFYQFKRLTFGLTNAPGEFQRLIDQVLDGPDLEPFVFRYLDDVIIVTESLSAHLSILEDVFDRLRAARLKINWAKSEFGASQVKYLGYIVDREGLRIDPDKIKPVLEYPTPTSVKQLRRIIGMVAWYKKFIPNLSKQLNPLTKLLKKGQKWFWTEAQQKALDDLKTVLTTPPVLSRPDWSKEFRIETDASLVGLGAVLIQTIDDVDRVIEYASRSLTKAEKNYSVTELELLAVIFAIKRFRPYIEGYPITCVTDHRSLQWLHSLKNPTARLSRWIMEMQGYEINFKHRSGRIHFIPDALSRINSPDEPPDEGETTLLSLISDASTYETWYQEMVQKIRDKPEDHPEYSLNDSLLYYHKLEPLELLLEDDARDPWKLVPTLAQISTILTQNHDDMQSGHLGILKTFNRISAFYFWPGMFQDVADYVRSCTTCQKTKPVVGKPPGQMYSPRPVKPADVWYLDLIGPLPCSSNQNKFILVMLDEFTKYVEIIPLRNSTGKTVTQHFKKTILNRYGAPRRIITDNGTPFINSLMKTLSETYGFEHQRTPPYHPQANSVERQNRVVKQIIRAYINSRQTNWCTFLPEVAYAINTSVQSTTGFTPHFLMYGRETHPIHQLRRDLESRATDASPEDAYPEYVFRQQAIKDIYELVKLNQIKSSRKQATYYNKRHNLDVQYDVGEMVLRRNFRLSNAADHYNAKLDHLWIGPCEVIYKINPVIYKVKDPTTGFESNYHVKDLRRFKKVVEIN